MLVVLPLLLPLMVIVAVVVVVMVVGVFEQTMLVIIFHDGEGILGYLKSLHLCHHIKGWGELTGGSRHVMC